MDKATGRIYESVQAMVAQNIAASRQMEMNVPPTTRQLARGHVGRNEPCPCGSGKKFKKCCLLPR
jgi:uncharacterized protein YecA (UPF0149 family)